MAAASEPKALIDGELYVIVKEAINLQACDSNGLSDPFVVLRLVDEEKDGFAIYNDKERRKTFKGAAKHKAGGNAAAPMGSTCKTTIKKKTLSPSWHEQFAFDAKMGRTLQVLVYDWDRLGSNDLCGTVDIDVTRLGLKNQVPLEFGIALHPQGTLTLQLEYVDGQSLFGLDLDSVAERESQRVPLIMQTCIRAIEERGMYEPGIYRLSGSMKEVRQLKAEFTSNSAYQLTGKEDINAIASLLKLYLRELPEPLMTYELYHSLLAASATPGAIGAVIRRLPAVHLEALDYLFTHLVRVKANSDVNKMVPKNIATCFGPTLMKPPPVVATPARAGSGNQAGDGLAMDMQGLMGDTSRENLLVETLLSNYEVIMTAPVKREQMHSLVKVKRKHVARASSNTGLAVRLFVKYDTDASNSLE